LPGVRDRESTATMALPGVTAAQRASQPREVPAATRARPWPYPSPGPAPPRRSPPWRPPDP